jgi:uncharacterized protein (TIGR02453 family)
LLEPAQAFVFGLGRRLQTLAPDIRIDTRTDGTGVLMRIHRDTRFSQDKTPYKTTVSGLFWEGQQKKTESPAFGFQMEATGMDLMAGIFQFPPTMLTAYRSAVVNNDLGTELEHILTNLRATGEYQIAGEHYKRVPSGYDPNHRRANLLRYAGLYALSPHISVNDLLKPDLLDICYVHFQQMASVQHWLMKINPMT